VEAPVLEDTLAMNPAVRSEVAALAAQYGPMVFRAAWRVLGSRSAAEDVQQQVFLKLLESPPAGVESWPAFLTTSATRLAIDHLRRQRRWRILAPLWPTPVPEDSPLDDVERAEAARFMRGALARLPSRDATCFVLRHLHGMSPGDIGRMLGLSENHVSVSVHRARTALEALQQKENA
jgi:RNA polymerase sigma factor (sigma-70 family)